LNAANLKFFTQFFPIFSKYNEGIDFFKRESVSIEMLITIGNQVYSSAEIKLFFI